MQESGGILESQQTCFDSRFKPREALLNVSRHFCTRNPKTLVILLNFVVLSDECRITATEIQAIAQT